MLPLTEEEEDIFGWIDSIDKGKKDQKEAIINAGW